MPVLPAEISGCVGPQRTTASSGGRRIGTVSSVEAHSSRIAASRPRDLAYAPAGVVWASIVRPSAPSVIGTLRGFADSATGIRNVSTPVS